MLALNDEFGCIQGMRGRGLLQGLVVNVDGNAIAAQCLENGLVTICTNNNVLRFLPPLTIERPHVDEAVEIMRKSLRELA